MVYDLPFGSGNAGKTPQFTFYVNANTRAALTPPALSVIDAGGHSYFTVDWTTVAATAISYTVIAEVGGTELQGTISADVTQSSGSASPVAAASSTNGYWTAGPLIARALVRCGVVSLSQSQIAAYDPIVSTDANVAQMVESLNEVGKDLAVKIKSHLERTATFTTAGSATSYALPADYLETVPQSQWDRSTQWPMFGPVSAQREQRLIATNTSPVVGIEYRIQGNLITFPVAPANGLSCALKYYSRYWVQTAGASSPDADHVTAAGDYVLFDDLLVVRALRWRFASDKGLPEAGIALAEFEERLEWAKGTNASAPVLSLTGRNSGFRFLDRLNAPDTGYGS